MVSRGSTTGMHVHFIVRQAHDRLLTYVPAFQSSFLAAIEKFEPRVSDWLLSLSWQFEGMSDSNYSSMPDPVQWTAASTVTAPGAAAGAFEDDEMTQDLQALFAIRDAALKQDSTTAKFDQADFQPTEPSH